MDHWQSYRGAAQRGERPITTLVRDTRDDRSWQAMVQPEDGKMLGYGGRPAYDEQQRDGKQQGSVMQHGYEEQQGHGRQQEYGRRQGCGRQQGPQRDDTQQMSHQQLSSQHSTRREVGNRLRNTLSEGSSKRRGTRRKALVLEEVRNMERIQLLDNEVQGIPAQRESQNSRIMIRRRQLLLLAEFGRA